MSSPPPTSSTGFTPLTIPTDPDETTTVAPSAPFNMPFWGWILIAGGVVGILALIVLAAKRMKSSKKKQRKIAEYRTKEDKRFAAVAAELGEVYAATDHVKVERDMGYYKKKGQKQIKRTG